MGGGSSHTRKLRMSTRQRDMKNMSSIRKGVSKASDVRNVQRTVGEAGIESVGIPKGKSMEREVEGISRVISMLMSFFFFRSYSG